MVSEFRNQPRVYVKYSLAKNKREQNSFLYCRLPTRPTLVGEKIFNHVCEQRALVDALDAITLRWNYVYSEEYFYFPDSDDPCPSLHFKGVAFGVSDKEVIIAEVEYWQYVRQVGLFWIEHNRTDKKK